MQMKNSKNAAKVLTSIQDNYNRIGLRPQDLSDIFVFSEVNVRTKGNATTDYYTDSIDVGFYDDVKVIVEMDGNSTVTGTIAVTMQETPLSEDIIANDYWTTAKQGTTNATGTLDRSKVKDNISLEATLLKARQIRFKIGAVGNPNPNIEINIKGILK